MSRLGLRLLAFNNTSFLTSQVQLIGLARRQAINASAGLFHTILLSWWGLFHERRNLMGTILISVYVAHFEIINSLRYIPDVSRIAIGLYKEKILQWHSWINV